jgi:RNA polymerase sigma-70 factor, ECF subfamily
MVNRELDRSADPGRVIAWRIDRMHDAGFSAGLAEALAHDTRYDVHALLELADRGCPAELAARILAPVGRERAVLTPSLGRSTDPTAEACSAGVDRAPMAPSNISLADSVDRDSRAWIARLSATSAERDAAPAELQALLLRAARFEINRRRATSPQLRRGDYHDLAVHSAEDARIAILRKLGEFRGESRFTTWAYKFALYEAAAKVRKHDWQRREIPLTAETWPLIVDEHQRTPRPRAEQSVETTDTLTALREAIDGELSPHQREMLVAIALNGVPIDVLAERLNTTRGALYKTLNDGRQKLKAALTARGLGNDRLQGRKPTAPALPGADLLLESLTGPRGPELSCDQSFEQLDRYVELELAGSDAAIRGMRAHLEGCSACAEDRESLHTLLVSDAGSDA